MNGQYLLQGEPNSNRGLRLMQNVQRATFFRFLGLMVVVLFLAAFTNASTALGNETKVGASGEPGSIDFESAVRVALAQSPVITRSQLQIEVHRLDESDAKLSYIPRLALSTAYYPNPPVGTNSLSAITILVGPYNPVESYFSVKAARLLREAAVIKHKQVIADGIHELAKRYLDLEHVSNLIDTQKKIVAATSESVAFTERLVGQGKASELDREEAFQDFAVAQVEQQKLETTRAGIVEEIKGLLGLEIEQQPVFESRDARQQVLTGFDPAKVAYEDVRKNSFALQLLEKESGIRSLSTANAYARFIPTLSIGVRNPDPLGESTVNNDLYAYVGVNLVLWDGYKRVNEISRQELKTRQFLEEGRSQKTDLKSQWLEANRLLRAAEMDLKLQRSMEKLSDLRERKTAIAYKSGDPSVAKPDLIAAQVTHLETVKRRIDAEFDRDLAILSMRYLSGDLFNKHVQVTSTEE